VLNLSRSEGRRELSEFLRTRRARLSPADVGIQVGARRRTPGLRREEVAQLAGVGVTWYTWFEQGREIQVSEHFLENLARGLRLDAAERDHLFAIAHQRPAPIIPQSSTVSPSLRRMIDSLPNPAYVRTVRWDLAAWNLPTAVLFGDFDLVTQERRNILWLLFTDLLFRSRFVHWETDAQQVIAKFRLDFGRSGNDPAFLALIRDLEHASPEFHRWWPLHDVNGLGEGLKRIRHVADGEHVAHGEIEFEHTTLAVENAPDLRVIIYTPAAGESAAIAHTLFGK
jgi:transcriptional regulator with XRE-family HTH domain